MRFTYSVRFCDDLKRSNVNSSILSSSIFTRANRWTCVYYIISMIVGVLPIYRFFYLYKLQDSGTLNDPYIHQTHCIIYFLLFRLSTLLAYLFNFIGKVEDQSIVVKRLKLTFIILNLLFVNVCVSLF